MLRCGRLPDLPLQPAAWLTGPKTTGSSHTSCRSNKFAAQHWAAWLTRPHWKTREGRRHHFACRPQTQFVNRKEYSTQSTGGVPSRPHRAPTGGRSRLRGALHSLWRLQAGWASSWPPGLRKVGATAGRCARNGRTAVCGPHFMWIRATPVRVHCRQRNQRRQARTRHLNASSLLRFELPGDAQHCLGGANEQICQRIQLTTAAPYSENDTWSWRGKHAGATISRQNAAPAVPRVR